MVRPPPVPFSTDTSAATRVELWAQEAFQCAVADTQGLRPSHEDEHVVSCTGTSADLWVLDGHRGAEAAKFSAKALPSELGQAIKDGKLPTDARIQQSFRCVDNQLRKHLKTLDPKEGKAGCTVVGALVALQADGTYTAKLVNCGDSRGVLVKSPNEDDEGSIRIMETKDHRPSRQSERTRILAAGGAVLGDKVPRIDGRLAVSRTLGDFDFKADKKRTAFEQKVSCVPDVYEVAGLKPGTLLVLACDGLWSVAKSEAVARTIRDRLRREPSTDLQDLATALVQMSLRLGSDDNVTILVCRLGEGLKSPSEGSAPPEKLIPATADPATAEPAVAVVETAASEGAEKGQVETAGDCGVAHGGVSRGSSAAPAGA